MSVFENDLPAPPKLQKDTLRVVPLGGLGETADCRLRCALP